MGPGGSPSEWHQAGSEVSHPVGGLGPHPLKPLIVPPLGESLARMAVGASPQDRSSARPEQEVPPTPFTRQALRQEPEESQAGVSTPLLHNPQKCPDFTPHTAEGPAGRAARRLVAWHVGPENLFLQRPVWRYVCLGVRKTVILSRIRRAGRGRASHTEVTVVTKGGPC